MEFLGVCDWVFDVCGIGKRDFCDGSMGVVWAVWHGMFRFGHGPSTILCLLVLEQSSLSEFNT